MSKPPESASPPAFWRGRPDGDLESFDPNLFRRLLGGAWNAMPRVTKPTESRHGLRAPSNTARHEIESRFEDGVLVIRIVRAVANRVEIAEHVSRRRSSDTPLRSPGSCSRS